MLTNYPTQRKRMSHRSFILGDSNWIFFKVGYPVATSHFAATPQSDVVRICAHDFQRHGDTFGTTENAFSCIYNTQITVSPTSLFSANFKFNGNHVKNHPQPWTCPLTFNSSFCMFIHKGDLCLYYYSLIQRALKRSLNL